MDTSPLDQIDHKGEVALSFSCGKDSIVSWLYLRERGIKVHPYYFALCPDLPMVKTALEYYENFFDTKITVEDERHAIQQSIPESKAVFGSQELELREQLIIDFSNGKYKELSTKPRIAGSGCNFQRHCNWSIFLGIGFKFNDFIQAIHRVQRFGQTNTVRVDIIFSEAERGVRQQLERKWQQHTKLTNKMSDIIRTFGLSAQAMAGTLARGMGMDRVEIQGEHYRIVCVSRAV